MPFIGEDWRGPGEDWVKSEDGWEIRKVNAMDRGEEKKRDGVKRRRTKTEGDRPEDRKNAVVRFVISSLIHVIEPNPNFPDWRGTGPCLACSPSVPS